MTETMTNEQGQAELNAAYAARDKLWATYRAARAARIARCGAAKGALEEDCETDLGVLLAAQYEDLKKTNADIAKAAAVKAKLDRAAAKAQAKAAAETTA
jgi:hypothetical protein